MAQSDVKSLRRDGALQFPDVLRGLAGARAVLIGPEIRDGRSWAVVRVTFDDADTYDAFIDPQSGALGGYRILEDRQTRFEGLDDWRMVDGVRMPFLQTTKTETPGGDQTVKVEDMELNGAIETTQLARPSPVRKTSFRTIIVDRLDQVRTAPATVFSFLRRSMATTPSCCSTAAPPYRQSTSPLPLRSG